jgi:endonuclease-8
MPEGDTVFRAAQTLHRYLAGELVTRFESVYPALTRVVEDHPLIGRTIVSVSARGKHLLMSFSGGLVLRTHLRMNGS